MTYCIVQRDARSLAVVDANDPRVGVFVERASPATFWDFTEACDAARALAARMRLEFNTSRGYLLEDDTD